MEVAFNTIYPACQTDEKGIKPGSNLNNANKRVAEASRTEFLWWFFLFYVLVFKIFLCCWRLMCVFIFLVKLR